MPRVAGKIDIQHRNDIDQPAKTAQPGWRLEHSARNVFEIEILVEINEFIARERGDHKRRLAADDFRQAIEEFCQLIDQAIARYCRASMHRSRVGDCIATHGYVIFIQI